MGVALSARGYRSVRSERKPPSLGGGDYFCGWPTSLHLSTLGYEVQIIDNLSRRKIDVELECKSLTPIRHISQRLLAWQDVTWHKITFKNLLVAKNYVAPREVLRDFKPDALVHFAEQRAAPYSMKSACYKRYTVDNNLHATNSVLAAVAELGADTHVVHVGTMGVYGYRQAEMNIPEG